MDTTSIPWNLVVAVGSGLVVGLVAGILLMRRSSGAARVRELSDQLEASQRELAGYRVEVSEHFTRTSDLLRRMTIQYRAVYEHLAEGARSLCPDGGAALAGKIEEPSLPLEARAGSPASGTATAGAEASEGHPPHPASETLEPDEILDEELPPSQRA